MIPAERRKKILEYINNNNNTATIVELSDAFSVSEMTIHRDLHFLEKAGHVQKTYGGVVASPYQVVTDFNRRVQLYPERKEAIGKEAASMIQDGDNIFLDASTTSLAIVPFLANKKRISVFTTSVAALSKLSGMPNIELHSTGGLVYNGTDSFVGPTCTAYIKQVHVDKCFMSMSGICVPEGITDPISLIADVKKSIAESSTEVIVLADKSKFGRLSRFNIFPLSDIDLVITDAGVDTTCVQDLIDLGVEFKFA